MVFRGDGVAKDEKTGARWMLVSAERVEDQERLMRGALVALLPDAQVVEAGKD